MVRLSFLLVVSMNCRYKNRIVLLLIHVFVFALLACGTTNKQDNIERDKYNERIEFEKTKSYSLSIDTLMMPMVSYLEYDEDLHQLSLLDAGNNRIYTYQLGAQGNINPSGVLAIGVENRVLGFLSHSSDSMLLFDDNAASLHLFSLPDWAERWSIAPFEEIEKSASAHVEAGNDISTFNELFYGIPYPDYAHPMVTVGNRVYIPLLVSEPSEMGVPVNGRFVPSVVSIDLDTKAIDYPIPFSTVYDECNWGGGFFFRHTSIAPFKGEKLLVSYPADHKLYVWDITRKMLDGVYAGAYDIECIMPKDSTKEYLEMNLSEWGSTQPRYSMVVYDKYRDLIYRIANLPEKRVAETNAEYNPTVIIVLDGQMNYIGEWTIPHPEVYGSPSYFVTPGGLNIERKNDGDDDHISFDVYVPKL